LKEEGEPLPLHALQLEPLARRALEEDLGRAGDITTNSVVPASSQARGRLVARQAGVVCGLEMVALSFRLVDPRVAFEPVVADGDPVSPGAVLARVAGPARGILTAERVALNFLGHLSGIATATRHLVDAVAGTGARVVCTRKTTPGLRALEKHAVRCGGGTNHRFGLDDAVLIKDNHIAITGSIAAAVDLARRCVGHLVKIEVEVDTLEQLDEALANGVDAVLLDNMAPETLSEAVRRVAGNVVTEASGGITLETARAIAATGVDLLSVGWITHSAPALDVALDLEVDGGGEG
jgi:nicotinate-nucleotide pyrophosphorylase (carboxylating)